MGHLTRVAAALDQAKRNLSIVEGNLGDALRDAEAGRRLMALPYLMDLADDVRLLRNKVDRMQAMARREANAQPYPLTDDQMQTIVGDGSDYAAMAAAVNKHFTTNEG